MQIVLSYGTLYALVAAIGVPLLVSVCVWLVQWRRIRRLCAQDPIPGEVHHLSRSQLEMLFAGQYYPAAFVQPLHWALPWIMVLLCFTLPAAVLLDNGFVVGYGALAGLAVMAFMCFVLANYVIDEYRMRHLPWWGEDRLIIAYFVLAMLAGITLENWLL